MLRRSVNFKNWEGDYSALWNYKEAYYYEPWGWYYQWTSSGTESGHGYFYSYDKYDSYLKKYYNNIWILEELPSSLDYKNINKVEINLNAIGIYFTMRLYF